MKTHIKIVCVLLLIIIIHVMYVQPFIRRVTRTVSRGFRKAGRGIKHGVRKAGQGIKTGVRKAGQGIKTGVRKAGQGIKTGVRKTGEGLKKAGEVTGKHLAKAGKNLHKGLRRTGKALITASNFVGDILDRINIVKFIWKKLGACCIPIPSLCRAKRAFESTQRSLKYYNKVIDQKWKTVEIVFQWINKLNENVEDIVYHVERITSGVKSVLSPIEPPLIVEYNTKMNKIKQDVKWKNSSVVHLTRQGVTNFVSIEMAWQCPKVARSVKDGLRELRQAKDKCLSILRESNGFLRFLDKGWRQIKATLTSSKLRTHINEVKALCQDGHHLSCVSTINKYLSQIASANYGKTFELQEDLINTLSALKYSYSCLQRKQKVLATVSEYCKKGNEDFHTVFLQAVVDFFPNADVCTGLVAKDYTTKENVLKELQVSAEKSGFYSSCSLNNKEIKTKACLNYSTLITSYHLSRIEGARLLKDCKKIIPSLSKIQCHPGLCQHGGTCIEKQNSYSCQCATNYGGRHCERKIGISKANVCSRPASLGVETSRILDRQITASSEFDHNHSANNGRLHFKPHTGRTGAWSAKRNDLKQWLQVDFEQKTMVNEISTQGRGHCSCNQWVKSYTVYYSHCGQKYYPYREHNRIKVFRGNVDKNSIVKHSFTPPIITRFIRVYPRSWNEHISMRVGFNGCYEECRNPRALGMENGRILDSQIKASSQWNRQSGGRNGRLNFKGNHGRAGAWFAKSNNIYQWLQVDFQKPTKVIGISIQGREDCCNQFVKSYTISYSDDGKKFCKYEENGKITIFQGNSNRRSVAHRVLVPAILTRFIRIHPRTWNEHISMRVEFYGCS